MTAAAAFPVLLDGHQGGLLIEALAALPFKRVFELIGKLNRWANQCYADGVPLERGHRFDFDAAELALVLEALGELPYHRVRALVAQLDGQRGPRPAPASPAAQRLHG